MIFSKFQYSEKPESDFILIFMIFQFPSREPDAVGYKKNLI